LTAATAFNGATKRARTTKADRALRIPKMYRIYL
jgi:hypothetical protein